MNPWIYNLITALMMMGCQKAIRQMTISLTEIQPGDQILEVGCETGTLTLYAKNKQVRLEWFMELTPFLQ